MMKKPGIGTAPHLRADYKRFFDVRLRLHALCDDFQRVYARGGRVQIAIASGGCVEPGTSVAGHAESM